MRGFPPQVWTGVGETLPARIPAPSAAVDKTVDDARLYWPPRPADGGDIFGKDEFFPACEAHLSAKRPSPQAQARLPCAHVDEGRSGDPEAAPWQGSRPPLRVAAAALSWHL